MPATPDASPQPHPVEAVIVAGGFGTRLMPLTARRPKHLLEVGGVPFLEHQIARLAEAGVDHVVLATSYHADCSSRSSATAAGGGSGWTTCRSRSHSAPAARSATSPGCSATTPRRGGDPQRRRALRPRPGRTAQGLRDPAGRQRVDVSLHLVKVDDARAFGCVPTDDAGRVLDFIEKSRTR